jgi:hypothetical protein
MGLNVASFLILCAMIRGSDSGFWERERGEIVVEEVHIFQHVDIELSKAI